MSRRCTNACCNELSASTASDRHAGVRVTSGYIRRVVDLNRYELMDLCPGCTADKIGSCGGSRIEDCTRRIVKCMSQDLELSTALWQMMNGFKSMQRTVCAILANMMWLPFLHHLQAAVVTVVVPFRSKLTQRRKMHVTSSNERKNMICT